MPTSRSLSLLSLLLLALLACGGVSCRRPRSRVHTAPPRSTALSVDPAYHGSEPLLARAFVLHQQWTPRRAPSFVHRTAAEQAVHTELRASSVMRLRIFALGDRVLAMLPSTHPAASFQLLLADDLDRKAGLVVFAGDRWSYALPRSALPDVLDRTPSSRRELGDDAPWRTLSPPAELHDAGRRSLLAAIQTAIPLRYRGAGDRHDWSLRVRLTVVAPAQPDPRILPQRPVQQPLFPLALPLLATRAGEPLLEALTLALGAPLGWQLEVDNETRSSGTAPRFTVRVEDQGWLSLPRQHFAARRRGFQRARRLPPPRSAGLQILDRKRLSRLRSGPEGGTLLLRNESSSAVFVHVDGVRVAWVAAGRELTVHGLAQGYYRVFAHSPTGVRSWGPRDLYLPGALLLR